MSLRHFPDDYNLEYTSEGWFEIDDVLNCLVTKYEYVSITELKTIVDEDSKGRYEIDFGNDRIRAVYGHSIDVEIVTTDADVPHTLYHGTPVSNKKSILDSGLKPQSRQKVHLTESLDEAKSVGNRHTNDGNIMVFSVKPSKLMNDGYDISNPSGNSVYTISDVPPEYLEIV
jgi:putative RNA 2'-phosphotransferase